VAVKRPPGFTAPRRSLFRGRIYALSMSDSDNLFERIIAREIPAEILHETDNTLAFRDISPQASSHMLVVPKKRYRTVAELAAADTGLLAEVLRTAAIVAELEGIDESGYRVVFNTGADAGQTVFHVHAHVLGGEQLGFFGRHED
jgi:histidine triad (HIT) family protein